MRLESRTFCKKTSWRGREAYLLGNGLVRLIALTGGGHVAEFRFDESSGFPTTSPLWIPPWKTIEPYRYRPELHASRYGPAMAGKLLSGLVGHSICLDYFGSPSPEESKYGLSQHGEAPSARWHKSNLRLTRQEVSLKLSVTLPVAGLRFSREIKLRQGQALACFKETVINEKKCDHFFHWTQHVTLGPPFLSARDSIVVLPGTQGMTSPDGYDEGKALLKSGSVFRWPMAPARGGGKVDLTRPFLRRGLGFVVGVLLDPRREFGFVAALNRRQNLLMAYCFKRRDFPWAAVWEENQAIAAVPWKRRTSARGLEFGSTALPVPRREALTYGTVFGTPTFAYIPARGRKTTRYVAFLARVPSDWKGVRDIQVSGNEILVYGSDRRSIVRLGAPDLS